MLLLDNDCFVFNAKVKNSKDVIFLLSRLLEKKGAVSANYGEAAYKREQSYPTGLSTQPFHVAFPHAGGDEVRQSALAVAILAEPVIFRNMQDPHFELPTHIVFLLAIGKPDEQVRVLRQLVTVFSDPQKSVEFGNQKNVGDLVAWLHKELKLLN